MVAFRLHDIGRRRHRVVHDLAFGDFANGEIATINLSLNDVSTDSADYENFEAAVIAAIGSRTDLTYVGGVLTYTGDGSAMSDLVIDMLVVDDPLSEGTESFRIDLAGPASSTGSGIGLGNSSVTTVVNDNDQSNWSITGTTSLTEGGDGQLHHRAFRYVTAWRRSGS